MKAETVISREYKIMLRSKVFAGGDQQLLQVASNFWHDFKRAIDKTVGDKDGNLAKINNRRTIEFYDTDDHRLNKNSYIFRKRVNLDTGGQEVAHRSYTVFQTLQEDLPTWIDPDSKTKTAFVFG